MAFAHAVAGTRYVFGDLRTLLARATPFRSGDALGGIVAATAAERVAAQHALADLPLAHFLDEAVVLYKTDDVTRLLLDSHDPVAFAPVRHLTVGGLRDWLLGEADTPALAPLAPGLLPEMVAAVSKICRLQDLVAIAAKCRVVTRLRNTIGLPGTLSIRLQPNDPVDDPAGVAAQIPDGLLLGAGDAVIGVNPATDNPETITRLLRLLDGVRDRFDIPTQSCVLSHVTTTLIAMERGAPVDLVFQSIGGTQATNDSFCSACRWGGCLLHQPCRGRSGRHGRAADPPRRRRRDLCDGRRGRR
jgi:ethanolamine ammonia-lyase large subunit